MFDCKGCKALKAENEHLRGLVDRLLDKAVGQVIKDEDPSDMTPPPPPPVELDSEGNIIAEHHTYGMG